MLKKQFGLEIITSDRHVGIQRTCVIKSSLEPTHESSSPRDR